MPPAEGGVGTSETEKQMWDLWHSVPNEKKPQLLSLIESVLALQLEERKKKGE